MTRSVTGLFATRGQVDSVDGALRDAGFEPERITLVGPDGQIVQAPDATQARRDLGVWLIEHLMHRGHPATQAQQYHDSVAHEGRWLVLATVETDTEDRDARNVMVAVGAEEISSAANGKMIHVQRPGE